MPLLARNLSAPLTIDVRRGAVAELAGVLSDGRISPGGDVAIVLGPGQGDRVLEVVDGDLDAADVHRVVGGTLDAAEDLGAKLAQRSYDAVVGIGGGKTIDTAKYAASRHALPLVAVATSLAHDGLASPVSVLDHNGHRTSYGVHIPIAVLVDLDFVSTAPARRLRAGVGDAISNLNAVADWELAHSVTGEPVDGLAAAMSRTSAEAVIHHPGTIRDDEFLTVLAEGLVLGGLAMAVCGSSRPCSGGCHEISHALDRLFPGKGLHGEQVGLGALFCTFLRGDRTGFEDVDCCLRRHSLPRMPEDLGLTDDQFAEAVLQAPTTRPDRYTVLEDRGLESAELRRAIEEYCDAVRS